MTIRIYTMEKDEEDILSDWILHHGAIVGFSNIYIIDNCSGSATLEILDKFRDPERSDRINVYTKPDYRQKGNYIYELIKSTCQPGDIAIPLDLDEFIVKVESFEPLRLVCSPEEIRDYVKRLPKSGRYAFGGYLTSRDTKMTFEDPIGEIEDFDYVSMIDQHHNKNKKFFTAGNLTGLDHGNHHGTIDNGGQDVHYETDLYLIHYHFRGVYRTLEKCRNDIRGLSGIDPDDIGSLETLVAKNGRGVHNAMTYLKALVEGPYCLLKLQPDDQTYKTSQFAQQMIQTRQEQSNSPTVQQSPKICA